MEKWSIITTVLIFVFGIGISIIGFLLRNAFLEIKSEVGKMRDEFQHFKSEVLTDFVRKEDYAKNDESHKELWIEVRKHGERIAKIEGA